MLVLAWQADQAKKCPGCGQDPALHTESKGQAFEWDYVLCGWCTERDILTERIAEDHKQSRQKPRPVFHLNRTGWTRPTDDTAGP